jgi:hypothetical protein
MESSVMASWKDLSFFRMMLQKFEDVCAVNLVQSLLSGSHAIFQVRPPAAMPFPASHHGKGTQAGSRVAAQNRGHGRLRELAVGTFGEHSDASGGTHQAVEGLRVRADLTGQLVG